MNEGERGRLLLASVGLVVFLLSASFAEAQADPLEPIAAAVRRGADREALRALRASPLRAEPRARYLRARLLERLGRLDEALDASPPPEALPVIAEDLRVRHARLAASSGRCDEARRALAGSRDPIAQALDAQCALALGEHAEARDGFEAVVRRGAAEVDLFAARFALAEAQAGAGDAAAAARTLRALWVERAEHPDVAMIERALEAIEGSPPTFPVEARLARAERLRARRQHAEAFRELEQMDRPADAALARRWLHLRARALFDSRRDYARASVLLTEAARAGGPHAGEYTFLAARALSRADRDLEAVRAYRAFARRHPRHPRATEALFLAAWLELHQEVRGAEGRMERFLRTAGRRSPAHARQATWHLGLAAFEGGRYRRAEGFFRRSRELASGPLEEARGHYWVGRARQEAGDRRGAIEAYRAALYVESLHWYAQLARSRLAALGEGSPEPFPEGPAEPIEPARWDLGPQAAFYAELGLVRDASRSLRAEESQAPGRGLERLGALARAYARVGDAARAYRLTAGPRVGRRRARPSEGDAWLWRAAYPHPYREEVEAAAERAGLEDAHVYAVMRQESGFDPDVVSYADAIGLMQLLPRTAARVGESMGVTVDRALLFDPVWNVRVGARYLGTLEARFGVPLCFAGYNAGGHRVASWLEARGEMDLDLFVERIPITQTRNYIRRVTGHLARYRYLAGAEGGGWLDLPARVAPPASP